MWWMPHPHPLPMFIRWTWFFSLPLFQCPWDGYDFSLFLGPRVGCLISLLLLHNQSKSWMERKKRDLISYLFKIFFFLLRRERKKKSDLIWFLDPSMDLFDFLEKKIKRDKRFDNLRSNLYKGASISMRSESSDQISFV